MSSWGVATLAVGLEVGVVVGTSVGASVGSGESGASEPSAVGTGVGSVVGEAVADALGVGAAEGVALTWGVLPGWVGAGVLVGLQAQSKAKLLAMARCFGVQRWRGAVFMVYSLFYLCFWGVKGSV